MYFITNMLIPFKPSLIRDERDFIFQSYNWLNVKLKGFTGPERPMAVRGSYVGGTIFYFILLLFSILISLKKFRIYAVETFKENDRKQHF